MKITLPQGVQRIAANGKYTAREGDTVDVTPGQARQIVEKTTAPSWKVPPNSVGIVGTRKGRRCVDCSFLGQSWSVKCPRCGGETKEE